ncbi:Acetyltransferase [Leishmania braziliensis]|nr:Acetyltransferase [Leishmania braziliensis]
MSSTSSVDVNSAFPAMQDSADAVQWTKLDGAQKLLANHSDAKRFFTKYTMLRTVVGEVKPVFYDSVRTRVKVLCEEKAFAAGEECDDLEAVSMHVVAYFHYRLFMEEMKELMAQARLLKSIGMEGSGLRFQPRERNIDASGDKLRARNSCRCGEPSVKVQLHELSYCPAAFIPVGALRLRRVSKVSETGEFSEVVAKIDRVCVVKSVRCFDVGRVLMKAAEKIAREAFHVRWALVDAQLSSKGFYAKIGYAPKDVQTCMELHLPYVVMAKCLAEASL